MEQNNNLQKKPFPIFTVLIIAFVVVLLVLSFWPANSGKKISRSDFDTAFEADQIAGVYIYGTTVKGVYVDGVEGHKYSADDLMKSKGSKCDFYFTVIAGSEIDTLTKNFETYAQAHAGFKYDTEPQGESWFTKIYPFIYIGLIIIFAVLIFRAFNKMSGKNMDFGKNKAKMESNLTVRFKDVAGCEEEKNEMQELVEFLRNPRKFTNLGARIPKGVLMVGPPGTGKTLLGKAIAGEAGVPFFSITGSDFVEMFVGVGAARVRDLFETAKKNSPCLIFIDEIDAVGRQRGAGLGNTNDEREQTLNQLLVQMDGFESSSGIIVIAATNRPDVLDPALLRAGRFDRRITVGYPDVGAREKILRLYTKDKPMAKDINYKGIARHLGPGTTGADIESIVNEAAILAARAGRSIILERDIMEGAVKVAYGPQQKSRIVRQEDKINTAYHESGHAIVIKTAKHSKQSVHEISIVPRGMAAGYTAPSNEEDVTQYTKEQLLDQLDGLMGGRAAELIKFGKIGTGASNDIEKASKLARRMITEFGMSDKLGPVCYAEQGEVFLGRDFQSRSNISEKTAQIIDEEIKAMLEKALQNAINVLNEHKNEMEVMVKVLLEKETIYAEEVDMILNGSSAEEVEEVIALREKNREKEDEEAKKLQAEKDKKEAEKEAELFEELTTTAKNALEDDNEAEAKQTSPKTEQKEDESQNINSTNEGAETSQMANENQEKIDNQDKNDKNDEKQN